MKEPLDEEAVWRRQVSARLVVVEKAQIMLSSQVQELLKQQILADMNRNASDEAIASVTIDRLDSDLNEIREKKDKVAEKIAQAQLTGNANEQLTLELMLDNYEQREKRIRQERDAAIVVVSRSKAVVDDSQEKIKRLGDPSSTMKINKSASVADKAVSYVWDKIGPIVVTGLFLIILNALWEYIRVRLGSP